MGCGGCRKGVTINLANMKPLKAPTMDSDGSIVYPDGDELPIIEGYKRTPDDPQRLVPEANNGCRWKITGIMLKKDGSYKPLHVCRNSECSYTAKPVTPAICIACPHRQP